MKKRLVKLIVMTVLGAAVLTGCGNNKKQAIQKSTEQAVEKENATATEQQQTTEQQAAEQNNDEIDNSLVGDEKPVVDMPADGEYSVDVVLEGGSGKATVETPAKITIKEGYAYATIVWSSKNYDYMLVDGEKYMNENDGANSTFTFPIPSLPCTIDVVGDTTAMSTPHEIDYTLTFSQIQE